MEENLSHPYLHIQIFWSPTLKKQRFQVKAISVSSENRLGPFDILPEHANFISLISKHLIVLTLDKKKHYFQFKRGVLEVYKNKVRIFLEI